MIINDKIRNEKLQHDVKREAAKYWQYYLSGQIDKCEYLADVEILPSDQSRIVEQAKSAYSPLGKALKNN